MIDEIDVQNADVPDGSQVEAPTGEDGRIGYKRPPTKSRFRKGQSGNPFGRCKGQRPPY